jgi:beta-lactamase class D
MLAEKTPNWSLWAKTGWAARNTPQIGWYVGYVETADDVWFFATNIDIRTANDLPLRQSLTREALQAKGIIE